MNRILIIAVFIFLPALMNAQEGQTRSYKAPGEKVMAFLMGSGQTSGGEFVYTFETKPMMEYTIVVTPLSENTNLYVSEKTDKGFTVKTKSGMEASFDFVIFVRKESLRTVSPQ